MMRILIIGENSYIGTSFEKWLEQFSDKFQIDKISVRDETWKTYDFTPYDVVYRLAARVHKKEKPKMELLYSKINCDLSLEIAKKSKISGVKQFIFMSTMAVYGEIGNVNEEVVISRLTNPNPKSLYGKSKLEAERQLEKLKDEGFKIVILRPPMIYGENCPGNYAKLEKLAKRTPVFPLIENERSMLHVNKLSELLLGIIIEEKEGLFLPQDDEYVNTSFLVKKIAEKNGHKIYLSKKLGNIIKLLGKKINLINKIFGNLVYKK